YKLILWPYKMKRAPSEYYRMLTSGFVHLDFIHLAFNMLTFFFFADYLAWKIGNGLFTVLYFSAIIIANIPAVLKHKNNYQYTALGASGGVAAIVFAFIYLNPWENLKLFMVVPFPAILFAVAYVVFSYKMK